MLQAYASHPETSRGRAISEPTAPDRSCFQRDRDRIVHSTAFRRLQYKTQVFLYHKGDHYRTRLTHTIEVAQIARVIARALGLNEDLAETLALAHDLGHPPFGHAGEEALNNVMGDFGGFDHNDQTLRILTNLEHRYAEFDGLNLSWETLEGAAKHNGPITAPSPIIAALAVVLDFDPAAQPSAEAQIAGLADDIAYNNHDIDDGLRADLFAIEALADLPLVGKVLAEIDGRYPKLERPRRIHEAVRRLINLLVGDVIVETGTRIARSRPGSADQVRALPEPLVAHSAAIVDANRTIKAFLLHNMYRHARIVETMAEARNVVIDLFHYYFGCFDALPEEWQNRAGVGDLTLERKARRICDYIAGMTDRFALEDHRQRCKK